MRPRQSGLAALVAIVVGAASLGCSEIPQDARKPFAGPEETRGFAGNHSDRASTQDEYLITRDAREEGVAVAGAEPRRP